MQYGTHYDNPFMGNGSGAPRTKLALTLFLSDPASYEGGELVIETNVGPRAVKLGRGDAIAYSADSLHRVNPVKGGVKLAAVTWVQSLIRDPSRRELLYDLSVVRQWARKDHADTKETMVLGKIYSNLMRMWADF